MAPDCGRRELGNPASALHSDLAVAGWCLLNPAAGPGCWPAGGDRPYLVSGADDRLVKVWDYQTKACIQVGPLGR